MMKPNDLDNYLTFPEAIEDIELGTDIHAPV